MDIRVSTARLLITALLGVMPSVSMAALISLNPTNTGSITKADIYTIDGTLNGFAFTNPLVDLAYFPAEPIGQVRSTSLGLGYLLFDVSAFPYAVETAAIEFDLEYFRSAPPNLTVTALDFSQAQSLSSIPAGTGYYTLYDAVFGTPEQKAAYSLLAGGYGAIESGRPLGTLADWGPLDGLYSLTLDSAAMNMARDNSGLVGLGLTWTPTADIVTDPFLGSYETGSDRLHFNAPPTLTLTGSVNSVPLPGTLGLLVVGMMLLLQEKRKFECYTNPHGLQVFWRGCVAISRSNTSGRQCKRQCHPDGSRTGGRARLAATHRFHRAQLV